MLNIKNSVMLHEAKKAKHKPHAVVQILIFIAVMFVSQLAAGLVLCVPLSIKIYGSSDLGGLAAMGYSGTAAFVSEFASKLPQWFNIVSLFATGITTALVIIYCRSIEGRSLTSMGLCRKGFVRQYSFGYLIGVAMMTATVVLSVLLGSATFNGLNTGVTALYILLFFAGYLIQGMSEELCFRGYFMVSCANSAHMAVAVFASSLAFALLHLANPGITALAFLNILLFGVFAAVYILRTDDLWGACAIHSAWNFFQGNIFGISVSGSGMSSSVFGTTFVSGHALISGGAFGIEGGLCTTIVLLGATALAIFLPQKERPELPSEAPAVIAVSEKLRPVYIQK